MSKLKTLRLARQSGFTLIELSIVAVIVGIMAATGLWYMAMEVGFSRASAQADQLKTLNNSLVTYETAFFQNLINNQPIPGVANAASPTVAELITTGVLNSGFSANNLYGGTYKSTLTLTPTACVTSACDIVGVTYMTTPIRNTQGIIDYPALGEAMRRAGGDAAFSSAGVPSQFAGQDGNWSMSNPLGAVPGILAMRSGYGSSGYNQFFRRDGTQPMTGNANIGGNDINNAKNVNATNGTFLSNLSAKFFSASGSITNAGGYTGSGDITTTTNVTAAGKITAGTLQSNGRVTVNEFVQLNGIASKQGNCAPNGLIGQDGNGVLLSCQNSIWTEAGHPAVPLTCNLPWGGTLASGQAVSAYLQSIVPYGGSCQSEVRSCTNGSLSGSYTQFSCTVQAAAQCSLPWGGQLASGGSALAYQYSSVPYGSTCNQEYRTCNNGSLSGAYTNQSCSSGAPASCQLPWGGYVGSGGSVTAYLYSSVAYGSTCYSQQRGCFNGSLAGSYSNPTCSVASPPIPTGPATFDLGGYVCAASGNGGQVVAAYMNALGRCADDSGFTFWTDNANKYGWSYTDIYNNIVQGAMVNDGVSSPSQLWGAEAVQMTKQCVGANQWSGSNYRFNPGAGRTCTKY